MIERLAVFLGTRDDPYENLAVEQALLESVDERTLILYLWQNRHTVVIGKNQNAWRECKTALLEQDGGLLARRLSGGGAVYHDMGNLNFTFLVQSGNYDVKRQMGVIAEACRAVGIDTEISGRNDLLAAGRKFSGSAFYHHAGKSYHHGTLLVNVNLERLSKYLNPSKAKLSAKGVASVLARVVNLEQLQAGLTVAQLRSQMVAAAERVYGLRAEPMTAEALPEERVRELRARNQSWAWNYGNPFVFDASFGEKFTWGEVELQLQVHCGVVQAARVYSDAMDWTIAQTIGGALPGCRFQSAELIRRIQTLCLPQTVRDDLAALLRAQEF